MWPFIKNVLGLYRIPRYRLIQSYTYPGRYYLWDRKTKKVYEYFDSLDEAMLYIHIENIDCDEIKAFT